MIDYTSWPNSEKLEWLKHYLEVELAVEYDPTFAGDPEYDAAFRARKLERVDLPTFARAYLESFEDKVQQTQNRKTAILQRLEE